MLNKLFGREKTAEAGGALYRHAVEQGRTAGFYETLNVADTVDGRFEMISLHVFLLLHRIKQPDIADDRLAQAVFDAMFLDMDRALREMGAGDLGVGRRVKAMAKAFYGRIAAFEGGLSDKDALVAAIVRNVYRGEDGARQNAERLAAYVLGQAEHLAAFGRDRISSADISFRAFPE